MNTVLYYFSATGNSLEVAKTINLTLQGELLPMQTSCHPICHGDIIGFVFPTFFWGTPHIVDEFIKTLQITSRTPYIFAITTCGGISGNALSTVHNLLKQKGYGLDYGKAIRSVSNYIVEYNINTRTIDKRLSQATQKAAQIADDLLQQKKRRIPHTSLLATIVHHQFLKKLSHRDLHFHVENTCTQCGTCVRVCPNENIQLLGTQITFQHHCEHCIACVHWCPQQAIQYKEKTYPNSGAIS